MRLDAGRPGIASRGRDFPRGSLAAMPAIWDSPAPQLRGRSLRPGRKRPWFHSPRPRRADSLRPEAQPLWLLAARVLWFALGVACGIKALVSPEMHTVYTAFSGATHDWWSNQSLYFQRAYYYSPTFAVLLTPLAIWSNAIGGMLWIAASVTLLWLGLRRFYRDVLPSHSWPAASEGKFLLIALVGSVRSLWSAQSNARC